MLICAEVMDAFERVQPQIHSAHRILGARTRHQNSKIDMRRSYRGYWKTNLRGIGSGPRGSSVQTNAVLSEQRVNATE